LKQRHLVCKGMVVNQELDAVQKLVDNLVIFQGTIFNDKDRA